MLPVAPEGLGVGWIFQLLPFQRSASVRPAAVRGVAAVHDTPLRLLPVAPEGLGVGWIFQLGPVAPATTLVPNVAATTKAAPMPAKRRPMTSPQTYRPRPRAGRPSREYAPRALRMERQQRWPGEPSRQAPRTEWMVATVRSLGRLSRLW